MNNIVLLGDSVFDNGVYVDPGEPDVVEQLTDRLPDRDQATLLAVDGHVTRDVPSQLEELPDSASHLILSVGGNDGLRYLTDLEDSLRGSDDPRQLLARMADMRRDFADDYRQTIQTILQHDRPTCVLTIYSGAFDDHGEPETQRIVDTMLPLFNKVILDTAMDHGLPVVVLDRLLDEPGDYANPIEPSAQGGHKIARTIQQLVDADPFSGSETILHG